MSAESTAPAAVLARPSLPPKPKPLRRTNGITLLVAIACAVGLALNVTGRESHLFPNWAGNGASTAGGPPPTPAAPPLTIPATYTVPGALTLAWPSGGESALAVAGVGTMATNGPADTPVPIASVTKTMTAYLILKDHPMAPDLPGATLTVEPAEAASYAHDVALNQSLVPVKSGEELTEQQALQALMLASADNVAQILGRWDAGTDDAFVAEMNAEAAVLGMAHTHFTDPSGYDPGTRSSANDLIKLAEAAMLVPAFAQIVAEPSASIPVAGTVTNYNKLLGEDGVVGIKTGSTTAAGGCLLFAATDTVDGQTVTVIGVVLGAPGANATAVLKNVLVESDSLLESADRALTVALVAKQGKEIAKTGPGTAGALGPAHDVTVVGWPGLALNLRTAMISGRPVLDVTMPGGATLATTRLTAIPAS